MPRFDGTGPRETSGQTGGRHGQCDGSGQGRSGGRGTCRNQPSSGRGRGSRCNRFDRETVDCKSASEQAMDDIDILKTRRTQLERETAQLDEKIRQLETTK